MDIKTVIDQYLEKGFGSMNKNDFEVWIFHQLMQEKLKGKSNYEISTGLKLPETKVKRLRYEANLKYGKSNETVYHEQLKAILKKAHVKKDGSCIQFVIEDVSLRKFLDYELKKGNRFSNSSFNSEIVSLDIDDLQFILEIIAPGDLQDVLDKAKKELNDDNISLKKLFKIYAENFAKGAGDESGRTFIDVVKKGILAAIFA